MTYQDALDILSHAVRKLDEDDGNMSSVELTLHTLAVSAAAKVIERHNGTTIED